MQQDESTPQKIENARTLVRDVDRQIVYMIGKRLELVREIAQLKQESKQPIIDAETEHLVMQNILDASDDVQLNERHGRSLAGLLIDISVDFQREQQGLSQDVSKDQLLKRTFEKVQILQRKGIPVTRFEIGEPNFQPPTAVYDRTIAALQERRIFGYGPAAGLRELREAIANELAERYRTTVDADQVLIVPGARFAIFASILAFTSMGDRVIIPQPAWPAYEESVSYARARAIPLAAKLEEDWNIPMNDLEANLRGSAKMLVLNSPSNPTGKALDRKQFDEVSRLAQKHNCIIVSDEVYDRYVHKRVPSILEYPDSDYVYVNSFSKQFSLTGWRIAYLVTRKERVPALRRMIQTAVTCVPEFIQEAALHAIKQGRAEAQTKVEEILRKVSYTCNELGKIDVSFREPEGGFYVFPKVNRPNFDSVRFAEFLVDEYRISVSPGSSFGDYPEFFRLAVSVPTEQIPGSIKAIGDAIAKTTI
jgi:aspartate aminotransferase